MASLIPFAMRFVPEPKSSSDPDMDGIRYDHDLQIMVTADGNPWAKVARPLETSTNTNLDSKNDEGTDLY